jgi:hypothetical protein
MSTGGGGSGTTYSLARPAHAHSISIASNAAVFFIGPVLDLPGELLPPRFGFARFTIYSRQFRRCLAKLPLDLCGMPLLGFQREVLQYKYSAQC